MSAIVTFLIGCIVGACYRDAWNADKLEARLRTTRGGKR